MTHPETGKPTVRKPLRLWPGVVIVIALGIVRFVVPVVAGPDTLIFGMPVPMLAIVGGVFAGLAVVLWWLLFSRAAWVERLGAIALMIGALLVTSRLVDESISNGMMGMMLPIFAIPVLGFALVVWAVATRRLETGPRRASMVAAILLACGAFTVIRTGGISGTGDSDLHWRWTPSPEERLLAQAEEEPEVLASAPPAPEPLRTPMVPETGNKPAVAEPSVNKDEGKADDVRAKVPESPVEVKSRANWPGFRGPERDGIVRGIQIETDWSQSPPAELWRRPIGPGWSSFAVSGDLLYTQEQRGDDEIVACYKVSTGEQVWRHRDAVRFWESNGGAGPRGTPTLSNGRVYALGATGILKALDAASGERVWSRNAASDTGRVVPDWGFSSSPLVVGDVVIVALSGTLAGYDLATGNPRWTGPAHGGSYSSPHLVRIDGVEQVLMLNGDGATSLAPADGTVLWEYAWPGVTIVQPAVIADGDLLLSTSSAAGGIGMRRLAIAHGPSGWTVEERWTSAGLKPYFNDFVIHEGHAFGFDGSILSCIDLKDGRRKWKGGRYGHGQLVLLRDQDLLLVLSEEGEVALLNAAADQFTEVARFKAIDGKTWNHPVLAGDVLLVRNGEEMAAFRLPLAVR
jgi:outer membrane protein assembly factor BamB